MQPIINENINKVYKSIHGFNGIKLKDAPLSISNNRKGFKYGKWRR